MAAAILGIDPWKTKLQLWEQIILDKETPVTEAMQRGTDLEEKALKWFNEKLAFLNFRPVVVQSLSFPNLIASLDGWNGSVSLEIKCPSPEKHQHFVKTKEVPPHYWAQIQHQLMVTGSSYAYYLSFDGEDGDITSVERDESFIQNLRSQELAFLASLSDFRPPEPCDRDEVSIDDPRAVELSRRFVQVQGQIEMLQDELEQLRKELIASCTHNSNRIGPLRLRRVLRKGNIDYASIQELQGMDLEPYRKSPIESWRIL